MSGRYISHHMSHVIVCRVGGSSQCLNLICCTFQSHSLSRRASNVPEDHMMLFAVANEAKQVHFAQPMPVCKPGVVVQDHHLKNGYQLLYTPHVAKAEMWKTSGHLDFYAENMYDRIKVCSL